MGAGIGGGKSGSHQQSNQTGNENYSQTPTNLPFLGHGWNIADNTITPSLPNLANLSGAGAASSLNALPGAAGLAAIGAGSASGAASGAFYNNPANAALAPLAFKTPTNAADQYLTPTANGAYTSAGNPYFQGVIKNISDALQPQIDGNFAAAGRYGSGANANAFASALTKETGNLAYQNYTNERQNQLQAASTLSQNNISDIIARLQAAGTLSGNYATGANQTLEGASLIPGMTSNLFTPGAAATSAAWNPIGAYQGVVSEGNAGGTGTGSQYGTFTGNGTNWDVNAKAGVGTMGGGGAQGGGGNYNNL